MSTTERGEFPGGDAVDISVVQANGDPHLVGSECPVSGRVEYPPRVLCSCHQRESGTIRLSLRGRIYSAAKVEIGPEGFEAPYWVGYVDMPEGVRIFGPIDSHEGTAPKHGDDVEYRIRHLPMQAGSDTVGPVFTLMY